MTLEPGYQTITYYPYWTIYILSNISQSRANKTMKSGQVIEYN